MVLTTTIFWLLLAFLFYAYIGYGIIAAVWAFVQTIFKKPAHIVIENDLPNLTLVVPAYNEADILEQKIANTLASHVQTGDENNSPLPFKVNAITGETGKLKDNAGSGKDAALSSYTTNWSGTLELFLQLIAMNEGDVQLYQQAFEKILAWMIKYPLQTNKWGPFFEDIPGWSDTQINAITFAQFMMNHRDLFPDWQTQVPKIFEWVYEKVGNSNWKKYTRAAEKKPSKNNGKEIK